VTDDLDGADLAALDWSEMARRASLSQVFEHATGLAREAEQWYARKRPANKTWGRILRLAAIAFGAVGALLPILAEIVNTRDDVAIAPGWSAIALAVGAILVSIDKLFGFSAGWMRYMTAELRLKALRHDFEYTWNVLLVSADEPPSDAQVAALVDLTRTFVASVNGVVDRETGGWVSDFSGALTATEQSLRGPSGQ
jgi:hypothetical protein